MEEKVIDPLSLDVQGNPKTKILSYNTLTDLRPMSAADSEFLDIRKQVLSELASRPQTVAQRQHAEHESLCREHQPLHQADWTAASQTA